MLNYIIRRVLWAIPVLLIISLVTFGLGHAIPGGPFDKEKPLPAEIIENLEAHYGLNDPLWKQYRDYLWKALHGDLGPSYTSRSRTVNDILSTHFPVSAQLGVLALLVAMVIGIPLGMIASLKQNTFIDYFCMFFALLGVSVPSMTLGPLLVWVFALKLNILPVARWGTWQQAILPAFTLGIGSAAILARLTRASMLQVIREDYIRTARAKGVSEKNVTVHHALKNALIPVVTIIGPLFATLVTGSLIVEQIFAIPGCGKYFITSVTNRDYPVVLGIMLLYAFLIIVANLLVDITYSWIDPRIRYS
ncbi:MAG: ABC transporter permease [Candidatus Caldatribacteriota bacterium]|nr:ABC transporter permease [Candidatus Caldatribacteriota bacterium]